MRYWLNALLILIILTHCSCSIWHTSNSSVVFQENKEDASIIEDIFLSDSKVNEMYRCDKSSDMIKQIWVYFIVPVEFTRDEVVEHSQKFTEDAKLQYPDIFVMVLQYFDNKIYKKYGDTPLAHVQWAPRGSYNNSFDVQIGDYSTHVLGIDYYDLDQRYELDQYEMSLYNSLQSCAIGKTGKYINGFSDTAYPLGDMSIYNYVATQHGVSIDELIEIRAKATNRRTTITLTKMLESPPNQ